MNIDHWIKKHSTTVSDKSGFVIGPFIRAQDLRTLLQSYDLAIKKAPRTKPGERRSASKTE